MGNGTRIIESMVELIRHYNAKIRQPTRSERTQREICDRMNEIADIAWAVDQFGGPDLDCVHEFTLDDTITHVAVWRDDRYVATAQDATWVSEDGDEWYDMDNGQHARGKDFDAASIYLCGGPRNGENNMTGRYIGPTPITAYGCVLCQCEHRLGMDAEYQEHLHRQSKHGTYTRAPHGAAEEAVAAMLAEGIYPACSAPEGPWGIKGAAPGEKS